MVGNPRAGDHGADDRQGCGGSKQPDEPVGPGSCSPTRVRMRSMSTLIGSRQGPAQRRTEQCAAPLWGTSDPETAAAKNANGTLPSARSRASVTTMVDGSVPASGCSNSQIIKTVHDPSCSLIICKISFFKNTLDPAGRRSAECRACEGALPPSLEASTRPEPPGCGHGAGIRFALVLYGLMLARRRLYEQEAESLGQPALGGGASTPIRVRFYRIDNGIDGLDGSCNLPAW